MSLLRSFALAALASLLALAAACNHSLVIHRPQNVQVDQAYTEAWVDEIAAQAQDGDIILRRGYAVLSDLIVWFTPGDDITHAAIYDARTRTVIEAVRPAVREQDLKSYVAGAHRVVLIRPSGMSAAQRARSVELARSAIGTKFDHEGFLGLDDPDRFYCSELVVWAIQAAERGLPVDQLVIPGQLAQYGATLFDSGPRADELPARHLATR